MEWDMKHCTTSDFTVLVTFTNNMWNNWKSYEKKQQNNKAE